MLQFERQVWSRGCLRVAGVDEAGRGPLAGPVVAAAVLFEKSFLEDEEHGVLKGLTDSKKLSLKKRESFYKVLTETPRVLYSIVAVDVATIDRINILQATHQAMQLALAGLESLPDHALVDGRAVPGLPCASTDIVKGDAKSLSIAAASVLAKVSRDHTMGELDQQYPGYGLSQHKGYGTQKHLEALQRLGPTPCHRKSFRPVAEASIHH